MSKNGLHGAYSKLEDRDTNQLITEEDCGRGFERQVPGIYESMSQEN